MTPSGRDPDALVRVRGGEVVDGGSWVYVWVSGLDHRVVHVGATGLAPDVRTWLHLHDPRPHVGRIAAGYAAEDDESLDVLAFRVDGERAVAKRALGSALRAAGLLSDRYAGEAPATEPDDAPVEVAALVQTIHGHRVRRP